MNHLIAVYGTLKRGHYNYERFMDGAKFLGEFHTGEGFSLYVPELPYLVKEESGKGCFYELFEVSDNLLEILDKLEGHPNWYQRQILMHRKDKPIWIYVYQGELPKMNSVESYS